MATHTHNHPAPQDSVQLGARSRVLVVGAALAGLAGIAAAAALSFMHDHAATRFLYAYLFAMATFLSIPLGALLFVLVQHLSRAGWSVNVRRIAENMALTIPIFGVLVIPILVAVAAQKGTPYPWALPMSAAQAHHEKEHPAAADPHEGKATNPGHAKTAAGHSDAGEAGPAHPTPHAKVLDSLTLEKRPWLNPWFFIVRVVLYFLVWSWVAIWFWKQSVRQDADGDVERTRRMQRYSGGALVAVIITATYASFDLLMSLDPHWYSTIFGVYYISACAVSFFAAAILALVMLQRSGHLHSSVDADHYHDLGKYLFAFVFFWGYIAFSQYMLLWYANLPETTMWLARRGASTVSDPAMAPDHGNTWRPVAVALVLGELLIPFAGLLSRHIKRRRGILAFWALWVLAFHVVDMYWVVMPEMRMGFTPSIVDAAALVGIGAIAVAAFVAISARAKLRPVHDPRVAQSLAFTNV